jgi:hypothetical protein
VFWPVLVICINNSSKCLGRFTRHGAACVT